MLPNAMRTVESVDMHWRDSRGTGGAGADVNSGLGAPILKHQHGLPWAAWYALKLWLSRSPLPRGLPRFPVTSLPGLPEQGPKPVPHMSGV